MPVPVVELEAFYWLHRADELRRFARESACRRERAAMLGLAREIEVQVSSLEHQRADRLH